MNGITIKTANISDAEEISEILDSDLGYPCSPELVKKKLSKLDREREEVFTAVFDGKTVGVIHVEKYDLLYFETMANILGLAVSKAYRRQGIGSALIKAAEDWALENGISDMRLNSGESRKEAHSFYRSLGFDSEKNQIRFMKHI